MSIVYKSNDSEMEDHVDWRALARYIAGESSPAERDMIANVIEEDAALRELVYLLERTQNSTRRLPDAPDIEDSWGRMRRRIDVDFNVVSASESSLTSEECIQSDRITAARSDKRERVRSRPKRRSRPSIGWPIRIAAAVAIALLTFVAVNLTTTSTTAENEVVHMREVTTAPGQRATFSLGDGTEIVLNAASQIRVPETFEADRRHVYLEGEAHFDVAHDPTRPFVVHARNGHVEVLGTTFTVRSYPDDESEQVVVADGRVALSRIEGETDRRVVLERGQRGQLSSDGIISTDEVDISKFTSWIDGRLVFDEATLEEVAVTLERWYDVEVVIRDDQLSNRTISADLKGKYLSDVLDVLALTTDIRYELKDDALALMR